MNLTSGATGMSYAPEFIDNRDGNTLAEPLEATAKPVRKLAEKVNIERLAGHSIHFHAFRREAKRSRTPA